MSRFRLELLITINTNADMISPFVRVVDVISSIVFLFAFFTECLVAIFLGFVPTKLLKGKFSVT